MAWIQKIRPSCWICGSLLFITLGCEPSPSYYSAEGTQVAGHDVWHGLLQKHVSEGQVDYTHFLQDTSDLNSYLDRLNHFPPAIEDPDSVKMAFWINAYNAFTVKLILENYPLSSITDLHPKPYIPLVNTVWHQEDFLINDLSISLDAIEHDILRGEFEDPRIHFAINCASASCPPLREEAYSPSLLDQQLEDQAARFVNDSTKNELGTDWEISAIFSWFRGDFEINGGLEDFILTYAQDSTTPVSVKFKPYDWSLNDVQEGH